MKRIPGILTIAAICASCRPEARPSPTAPVAPPVESPTAIPDAPVNGTVRAAPFQLRDARYFVDRRVGYAHTDIILSSGKADAPCGAIQPARATSVWLRLEGSDTVEPRDVRIGAKQVGPWSVHYQAFDGEVWSGVGEGSAVLSLRGATADGHLEGGLAVCFADDAKSCVSGSFDAVSCPVSLDQPVRGAVAPEAIPARYLQALRAGSAKTADPGR